MNFLLTIIVNKRTLTSEKSITLSFLVSLINKIIFKPVSRLSREKKKKKKKENAFSSRVTFFVRVVCRRRARKRKSANLNESLPYLKFNPQRWRRCNRLNLRQRRKSAGRGRHGLRILLGERRSRVNEGFRMTRRRFAANKLAGTTDMDVMSPPNESYQCRSRIRKFRADI